MRPVDEAGFDAKGLVARGYDRCGEAYAAARGTAAPDWLTLLADRLPPGAAVLDVGCGSGVPIARALAERFTVTGVDISGAQVERACQNVPRARFIHADVMALAFRPGSFAAIVMVYTLFHLPRAEQPILLGRLGEWLGPDGLLLLTLPSAAHPGYVEGDFFGVDMYWSELAEAAYGPMLAQARFEVLHRCRIGHGYQGETDRKLEVHPLVLARQRP